jgi:ribosome biogenesis protein Nip4
MLEAEQFASSLAYESSEVEAVEVYKAMWQAAPEVEQEPVAFIDMKMFPPIRFADGQLRCDIENLDGLALYTHPQPKREPLSEEERKSLWKSLSDMDEGIDFNSIVTGVEKALGIGVE